MYSFHDISRPCHLIESVLLSIFAMSILRECHPVLTSTLLPCLTWLSYGVGLVHISNAFLPVSAAHERVFKYVVAVHVCFSQFSPAQRTQKELRLGTLSHHFLLRRPRLSDYLLTDTNSLILLTFYSYNTFLRSLHHQKDKFRWPSPQRTPSSCTPR